MTFEAGDNEPKTITVLVQGDEDFEPDEGFTVTLSNPQDAIPRPGNGHGHDQERRHGYDGGADHRHRLGRKQARGRFRHYGFWWPRSRAVAATCPTETTFELKIEGSGVDSADANDFDNSELPFVVQGRFPDNEDTVTVEINVTGDTEEETSDGFSVQLQNPQNGTIDMGRANAQGTILNDDGDSTELSIVAAHSRYTTRVVQAEGNTGDEPSTEFNFTVYRTGDTSVESTVQWSTIGSTDKPVNLEDFVPESQTSGELKFDAGDDSPQTITLYVNGDTPDEYDEGFTVTLSEAQNATIIQATATGTILDDDNLGGNDNLISFTGGNSSVNEGDVGDTPQLRVEVQRGDNPGNVTSSVEVVLNAGDTEGRRFRRSAAGQPDRHVWTQ